MLKRLGQYILMFTTVLLIACSTQIPVGDSQRGRILLWHSWSGEEEVALQSLLDKFHDVYPRIEVIAAPYHAEELKAQFAHQVVQGLGPDLLLGDHRWTPELVDAGFVREVTSEEIDLSPYLSSAIQTLEYRGGIFGVPLSVHTSALYFNRKRVKEVPDSLQAFLEEAQQGHKIAISSNFSDAFWGIGTFGGQLVDKQGRIILNRGGFTNWLDWLLEAQNRPNMVISSDQEWLTELFRNEEVDFYVGHSSDLLSLQADLGEEHLGVAPLPAGPNNKAGPLLQTEALFFSSASSDQQHRRALLLAEFLTNVEQQRKLAQLAGRIPAHHRARIDRRISPAVAGFVEQSKTSVPFRLLPQIFEVVEMGNDAYMQTLEGLVDAPEAADRLTAEVNAKHNLPVAVDPVEQVTTSPECSYQEKQELIFWHGWNTQAVDVLRELVEKFNRGCHAADIALRYIHPDELVAQYQSSAEGPNAPDLALISQHQAAQLHEEQMIRSLNDLIDSSFLQRYPPAVSTAMRQKNELFGLPLTMNLAVLYFNPNLTAEQPGILSDLLSTVSSDQRLVMPYVPSAKAHWGIAGFGGRLFDSSGRVTLADEGFVEWLRWLQEAQDNPGVTLVKSPQEALEQFMHSGAAYLVADQKALVPLITSMGSDSVRTIPLPAGPEGAAAPMLDVEGLVVNPGTEAVDAILEFAQYLTSEENQVKLMQNAYLLPANSNAQGSAHSMLAAFWIQAKTAVALPNGEETRAILELSDTIYEEVLSLGSDPQRVLADFSQFIRETYPDSYATVEGLQNEQETVQGEKIPCADSGTILVWHSNEEDAAAALKQIAVDFTRSCPQIQVELQFMREEALLRHLATADQRDDPSFSPYSTHPIDEQTRLGADKLETPIVQVERPALPDLILAPHDLIMPLSEERLIKPIDTWIDAAMLIPYQLVALDAMRYREGLYGIPYSMETLALYVNRTLISDTVNISTTSTATTLHRPTSGTALDKSPVITGTDFSPGSTGNDPANRFAAANLPELLSSSSVTQQLALGTSFHEAFWGIAAFGSTELQTAANENEEYVPTVDEAGLIGWLNWLQKNQAVPGLVLNEDPAALQELFAAGNAAFLVSSSAAYPFLQHELEARVRTEEDASERSPLAVSPLPNGPSGGGKPFLSVSGFLVPSLVAEDQARLALRFAQFASSAESQVQMARATHQPPIHALARAELTDPVINVFAQQAEVSVPLPPRQWNSLLEKGGTEMIREVLARRKSPEEAVANFIKYLQETPLPTIVTRAEESFTCGSAQQLVLWSSPRMNDSDQHDVVRRLIQDYRQRCPEIQVQIREIHSDALVTQLKGIVHPERLPNLILAPHYLLPTLVKSSLVAPIGPHVSAGDRSRFLWKAVSALQMDALYGYPLSTSVLALYYNADMVSQPIATLDDLRSSTSPETPLALDMSLQSVYWSLEALRIRPQNRISSLDFAGEGGAHGAALKWLTWLREFQNQPGILMSDDKHKIRRLFADEEAAYLIDGPEALRFLRSALGSKVRVIPLPTGPSGGAAPLLNVNAFFFPPTGSRSALEAALGFARFATSKQEQSKLQREFHQIPALVDNGELTADSALRVFTQQVNDASVVIPGTIWEAMLTSGNAAYRMFLTEQLSPSSVVDEFLSAVDFRNLGY